MENKNNDISQEMPYVRITVDRNNLSKSYFVRTDMFEHLKALVGNDALGMACSVACFLSDEVIFFMGAYDETDDDVIKNTKKLIYVVSLIIDHKLAFVGNNITAPSEANDLNVEDILKDMKI